MNGVCFTNCPSLNYYSTGRAEGSCCDVSIHCASLKCLASKCNGSPSPDASKVIQAVTLNITTPADVQKAEASYEQEYSPVSGVYTRLIIVGCLSVILSVIAVVLNCCAKKKGGWDKLCDSCCGCCLDYCIKKPPSNL